MSMMSNGGLVECDAYRKFEYMDRRPAISKETHFRDKTEHRPFMLRTPYWKQFYPNMLLLMEWDILLLCIFGDRKIWIPVML